MENNKEWSVERSRYSSFLLRLVKSSYSTGKLAKQHFEDVFPIALFLTRPSLESAISYSDAESEYGASPILLATLSLMETLLRSRDFVDSAGGEERVRSVINMFKPFSDSSELTSLMVETLATAFEKDQRVMGGAAGAIVADFFANSKEVSLEDEGIDKLVSLLLSVPSAFQESMLSSLQSKKCSKLVECLAQTVRVFYETDDLVQCKNFQYAWAASQLLSRLDKTEALNFREKLFATLESTLKLLYGDSTSVEENAREAAKLSLANVVSILTEEILTESGEQRATKRGKRDSSSHSGQKADATKSSAALLCGIVPLIEELFVGREDDLALLSLYHSCLRSALSVQRELVSQDRWKSAVGLLQRNLGHGSGSVRSFTLDVFCVFYSAAREAANGLAEGEFAPRVGSVRMPIDSICCSASVCC